MSIPNEFEYLNKVFNLERVDPNPQLPPSFSTLLPSIDISILKSSNKNEDQIRNSLKLNFVDRYPSLSMIIENKQRLTSSEQNTMFTIQYILQSISPPFLNSLTCFDDNFLIYLIRLVSFSYKLINSNDFETLKNYQNMSRSNHLMDIPSEMSSSIESTHSSHSKSSHKMTNSHSTTFMSQSTKYNQLLQNCFYFLYNKIISHHQFYLIFPSITRFFQKMQNFSLIQTEVFPTTPPYFAELHIKSCIKLLDFIKQYHDPITIVIVTNQLKLILYFFHQHYLDQKRFDTSLGNSLIQAIYEQTLYILNTLSKTIEIPDIFRYLLISLCLSFDFITRVEFSQVVDILIPMISDPPIISKEEVELKGKQYDTLHLKTPEELMLENDDEEPITMDSYVFPSWKNIDYYLSLMHHPLQTFIENINSFSGELHLILIRLIADYGTDRIVNENDANFQILLFILLSNLSGNMESVSTIFESKKNSSLFFTKCLFNPALTIFNCPESLMIISRFLVIPIFKVFITMNSNNQSFYFHVLLNFLNTILKYPEMFSEFFFCTSSIYTHFFNNPNEFQQVIINCAAQTLLFQQTAKFDGAKYHREFRALTFTALQQIIESIHNTIPLTELFDNLLLLLFEKCASVFSYQILEKYLQLFKSVDENTFKEIIYKLLNNISICKTNLKLFNPVLEKILNLIFSYTKNLAEQLLNSLKQTSFFIDIRSLIFLDDISINSIATCLKIGHISPETESEFEDIATIISKYEITEQMTEAVEICLSHNTEPFIGIANEKAVPLIFPILQSNEFNIKFLTKLHSIISNNITEGITIVKYNLMEKLINILNENSSPELFELIMNIFTIVSPHITNRRIVVSFLRLTSPIISKNDNKMSYRQSKFITSILDFLQALLVKRPVTFRSILKITSNKGKISELPKLSPKRFPHGFTFSFLLLVSNFNQTSDKLQLFQLYSPSSDKYLACYLSRDQIIFPVSQTSGYGTHIDYKLNQWSQISISFRNWETISIRVNGKLQENAGFARREWTESFTDNCLFGYGTGFVECQLAKFAIFENNANIEEDFDLFRNKEIANKAIFLLDSQSYSYDTYTQHVKMHNISTRSQFPTSYNFDGTLFTNISPFHSVFLYSKGIPFILSLFSQITFDFTPDEIERSIPSIFFLRMIELVCILIELNESIQEELVELNGFEIISHFLYTAMEKQNIQLKWSVTLVLLKIFTFLKNQELKISFIRSILLNFGLWKNSPLDVFKELFKSWLISAQSTPMVVLTRLRPEVILAIIRKLSTSNQNTTELVDILFDILQKSMLFHVTKTDIILYTELMKLKKESTPYVKELLIKLSTFVTLSSNSQDLVGSVLLTTDWLISDYSNLEIQQYLISSFANLNLNLLSILFLKNLALASQRSTAENDLLIALLCSRFVGVDLDNSTTDTNPVQILFELVDHAKEWNLNEMLLPICLSIAFYCSEEVSQTFSLFMYNVFSSNKRLVQISSILKMPTLFFMLSFAIFKTPTVIDFLTVLIISNPVFCSSCFQMIDLITNVLDCDFHDFQHLLSTKIITEIFEHAFELPKQPYLDMIIDFISFRALNTEYLCKHGQVTFTDLLSKFQNKESIIISDVSLRFRLDEKGNWSDFDLVLQLMKSLPKQFLHFTHTNSSSSDGKSSAMNSSLDLSRFMVLISFACHKSIKQSQPEFFTCLDSLTEFIPSDSPLWNPIIYQTSRHPNDFQQATHFMKIFHTKLQSTTLDLFLNNEKIVKTFTPKLYDIPENIIDIVTLMNTYKIGSPSETLELNDDLLVKLHKIDEFLFTIYEKYWLTLLKSFVYEQSPYNIYDIETNIKTGNYYTLAFFPSIKTGLDIQNIQKPIPTIVEKSEFEQAVIECGYLVATLNSPNNFSNCAIIEIDCQRIYLDKTIDGRLFLLGDTLKFISKSLKILTIKAIDTYAIFFFENICQLYLKNRRGYMFQFATNDETRFISSLQKTEFSKEINKNLPMNSNITEKWLKYSLSTLDYLILLNLLNGRSFISSKYYPILPDFDEQSNLKMELNGNDNYFTKNLEVQYRNRRILEDDKTSLIIHEWISFGFNEKNPPHRKLRKLTEETNQKITINNFVSPVIDFCIIGSHYTHFKVIALLKNGNLFLYSIDSNINDYDSSNNATVIAEKKNEKRRKTLDSNLIWLDSTLNNAQLQSSIIGSINKHSNIFVTFMNDRFLYVDGDTMGVFDFSCNNIYKNNESKSNALVSPISALDSCGYTVVTGSEDGSITLWDVSNSIPKFKNVLIFRNMKTITNVVVSEMFGLIVCCDMNGEIITARITDLRLLHHLTLFHNISDGTQLKKIEITNELGFILCLTNQSEVFSFTTSLEKVNKMIFDEEVIDFCTLPRKSGSDSFAIATKTGKILIYNAFTMEQEMFVCTEKGPIQKIQYSAEIQSFVLSMSDSPLVIIPFEL